MIASGSVPPADSMLLYGCYYVDTFMLSGNQQISIGNGVHNLLITQQTHPRIHYAKNVQRDLKTRGK